MLGREIALARAASGLSRSRAADLLGVSAGTLGRWERGTQRPGEGHRAALEALLTPWDGTDEGAMAEALRLAALAAADGEVPVGCVVASGGRLVGRGRNRREKDRSALAHAELEAIAEACRTLGGWRLWRATLYVTLEPCPMCAGAIVNARIERVVYAAPDPKAGCCGSVCALFEMAWNHHPRVEGGLLREASAAMLRAFFGELRKRRKKIDKNA